MDDARRLVRGYVEHYNEIRLNSAICYITLKDMLAGRQQEIHVERDQKWLRLSSSGNAVDRKWIDRS